MTIRPLRNSVSAAALAACLAMIGAPVPAQEQSFSPPADFSDIVRQLSPAVVGITARGMTPPRRMMPDGAPPFGMPGPFGGMPGQQPPQREFAAGGSGFMISEDGYIVTNNHVVEGATRIEVLRADGTTCEAELVGTDPATDIAVLRISDASGIAVESWGDSDAMEPGDWTIAIGSPFGLGGTVTVGVLSATSRVIGAGPYDAFLQTDASINSGNSGGPLFNTSGQVIGVNTAIFSPGGGNVGIGFAVPSSLARNVVDQLIDTGRVERGFIGVSLQPIDEPLARALGLDNSDGAIVVQVEPGAPADAAGIRVGDVILSIDGQPVEDPRQLSRLVADLSPNAVVPATVFREGERTDVSLTLAARDAGVTASDSPETEGGALGLSVAPVPDLARRTLGLGEGEALIVQPVQPDSPAAQAGILPGDVILGAGDQPVGSSQALSETWTQARDASRPLLLRISRNGTTTFLAVEAPEGSASADD